MALAPLQLGPKLRTHSDSYRCEVTATDEPSMQLKEPPQKCKNLKQHTNQTDSHNNRQLQFYEQVKISKAKIGFIVYYKLFQVLLAAQICRQHYHHIPVSSLSPIFMATYKYLIIATMLTGPKPCFLQGRNLSREHRRISSLAAGCHSMGRLHRPQRTCLGGEPARRSHIHRRMVSRSTCHCHCRCAGGQNHPETGKHKKIPSEQNE